MNTRQTITELFEESFSKLHVPHQRKYHYNILYSFVYYKAYSEINVLAKITQLSESVQAVYAILDPQEHVYYFKLCLLITGKNTVSQLSSFTQRPVALSPSAQCYNINTYVVQNRTGFEGNILRKFRINCSGGNSIRLA